MRVNPDMSGDMLAAIWQTQSQENTALQQISSGKRVNVPSDDPLAAAQMVGNQDQSNRADQYLQNIDTLTSQLQTADTAIGSAVAAITQAITLGVQGSTGTLSDANRQQIVQNLLGIQSQLVQLANTSVGGSYLFAGTASTAPPYALDSTSPVRRHLQRQQRDKYGPGGGRPKSANQHAGQRVVPEFRGRRLRLTAAIDYSSAKRNSLPPPALPPTSFAPLSTR